MKILLLLFLVSCSNLFYQPTRIAYVNPHKFVSQVEDVWFTSQDGTRLNAWWMPSTKTGPKGTIIFFHGNAQNLSSHFLNLAWITHEGYNVFIFDYRGYGMSQGSPNQKGVYQDALAGLTKGRQYHQQTSPKEKLIVYGQSLGGTISLRALADWPHKDEVDLLVMDSTFMSYQDIAFDKLTDHWLTFLFSPLAYLVISDKFAADEVIDDIKNPMLVISGKKDSVVPFKFSEDIYQRSKAKKKWFWVIEDGIHTDVFAFHEYKYRKDFLELLSTL